MYNKHYQVLLMYNKHYQVLLMYNKHYQVLLMYRKKIRENETTGEVSRWWPALYLL